MSSSLILVLIVIGGYAAARLAVDFLARRFLVVAGAEYLLLGVLLGPRASGLMSSNVVDSFGPFITLAIGWMGAVIGAELYLPSLMRIRGIVYQTALLEALLTTATVAGVMYAILILLLDVSPPIALAPSVILGAIAATTSSSGVALAVRRLAREGAARTPVLQQVQVAAGTGGVVAILVFSLLLCMTHPAPPAGIRPPTATEWAVITVAIGVIAGVLYHLFLGSEHDPDRLFIALAAAITLASGTAVYARLSPLLPTMLIGAILVNTSQNRAEIATALHRVQRPLYLVLLIFAGAAWRPSARASVWLMIAYVIIRLGAKLGAARIATRLGGRVGELGLNWGRALMGHGSLAVAIALNYRILDSSALPNLVFTAALVSVFLTDVLSARLVRNAVHSHRFLQLRGRESDR
jgi:hypothetical protein